MEVIAEGQRAIVIAAPAVVIEEGRELAWAETHVRRAPDVKWILGSYIHTSTEKAMVYNQNGHAFPYRDVQDSILDIPFRPLNYLHLPNRKVGVFTAAEFVWPQGEQALDEAPPIVETLAAYWALYDSDAGGGLWPGIEMAYREGKLYLSMESVPDSLTCMVDSCGQTHAYDGPFSPTYCSHMRQPRAKRTLNRPRFTAGALIVPPTRPGWRDANVTDITAALEQNLAEADIIYKEIASSQPHLVQTEIERITYELLRAAS